MENSSDHDLLIALNTKMEMMLAGQQQFINQWITLVERVTAIEIEQGRQATELKNLQDEVADLQKKSSFADNINMAVTAIASIIAGTIGYFFGPK
jgi:uncharacterized membrane-anchored protein